MRRFMNRYGLFPTYPLFDQFTDANEYYSTAFHESVHSTMKESRCNRAEDRKGKLVALEAMTTARKN